MELQAPSEATGLFGQEPSSIRSPGVMVEDVWTESRDKRVEIQEFKRQSTPAAATGGAATHRGENVLSRRALVISFLSAAPMWS